MESLSSIDYPKRCLEIILVDNCSTDGSVDLIKDKFSNVKIISNEVNNYCRANNLAIKKARGEFICLVNNDVKFDKNWLSELIKAMLNDKKAGAASSKILFEDGLIQSTGHYRFPNFYWADRGFREQDLGQYEKAEEIKSLSHCACIYRKKCLLDVGALDEDFNMFVEDVDMSIRAGKMGWRLYYVPTSRVYHKFHGTASEDKVAFLCERNRLLLVAKHFPKDLSPALFGKGYFTILNDKNELIKVLPDVFTKLLKEHSRERIIPLLPEIFESFEQILGKEKDHLIKEYYNLKKRITDQDNLISHKEKLIASNINTIHEQEKKIQAERDLVKEKDTIVAEVSNEIAAKISQLSQKDVQLSQKDAQLSQKDALISERDSELSRKDGLILDLEEKVTILNAETRRRDEGISDLKQQMQSARDELVKRADHAVFLDREIKQKDAEIKYLKDWLNGILNCQTYRFIVKPVWSVLRFARRILGIKNYTNQKTVLIIKPHCVPYLETQSYINRLRSDSSQLKIAILLYRFDESAQNITGVDEKILYGDEKGLSISGRMFLIFKLRKMGFDEAVVLLGNPVYQGYRSSKIIAIFSGAKRVGWFFVFSNNEFAKSNNFPAKEIANSIFSIILLFIFASIFTVLFVIPLKLKKLSNR
jgi:GT2 family glycosyltransferase